MEMNLKNENNWELIFTQVTGPPQAQIFADFSQLKKDNSNVYSLRLTTVRNGSSRWICLNSTEIDWLCRNSDVTMAGHVFSQNNRAIELRKYNSDKLPIVKICQRRGKRTCCDYFSFVQNGKCY